MPLWMYLAHPIMVVTFGYQERYSAIWDKELNRLMDSDRNPEIDRYTAKFRVDGGEYEVWISNRYYSYGFIYRVDGIAAPKSMRKRPSLRTMRRLADIESDFNRWMERKEVDDFISATGIKK
ncbi:hypothetical protein [Pantoea sp.]|uniref:hypothetical protein n=1 Tax=Pantoea sp. TaxID=69393 RepID=UPI0031DD8983